MKEPYIVIPSLNPQEHLRNLVKNLRNEGFQDIIIVNDGSREEYQPVFRALESDFHCIVLKHCVNQGKGRALKTAFNYYLEHCTDNDTGIITVDSDGQHRVSDVRSCAEALKRNPQDLILGCRDFDREGIPFKSRFGNRLTRTLLRFLCEVDTSDSQTGLRGFSTESIRLFLATKGERFEYETNMLIDAREHGIRFREVPIETIYINDNAETHFNPVVDSLKIYSIFLKYVFSSFSSFLIDLALFRLFLLPLAHLSPERYILLSTVCARVLSSVYNFLMNRNVVFKRNTEKTGAALFKYYLLCAVQMFCSGELVTLCHSHLPISETFAKIIIDSILFLVSFRIQKKWVFTDAARPGRGKYFRKKGRTHRRYG
ncbi:MAG: bifunctional glycosyltransferase family 2/GtrA family protein [Roseburia sp.]|nr:bifunctional glycosyltransferase family 2/GtrA family protein [Roseburia sp.]MCM1097284.1 bifunctional glycosyltransferase family 2/GtrA family protein [Ruminococcus flavefaciens]